MRSSFQVTFQLQRALALKPVVDIFGSTASVLVFVFLLGCEVVSGEALISGEALVVLWLWLWL
jgi:hypothetical protein